MRRESLAIVRGARSDLRAATRSYTSALDDLHLELEQLAGGDAHSQSANAAIVSHNDRLRDLYAAIDAYRQAATAMLDDVTADNAPRHP